MRVISKIHVFECFLWGTGCVRLYKDGGLFRFVFRGAHPVTWLMMVVCLIPSVLTGTKLSDWVPLALPAFWVNHSDQLQWVTPWTKLSSLKPFHNSSLANRFKTGTAE